MTHPFIFKNNTEKQLNVSRQSWIQSVAEHFLFLFFFLHSVYTPYRIITSSVICLPSSCHCDFMDDPWLTWLLWKAFQGEISAFVSGLHVFPSIASHSFLQAVLWSLVKGTKVSGITCFFLMRKYFWCCQNQDHSVIESVGLWEVWLFLQWLSCGSPMVKELLHCGSHFVSQEL